MSKRIQLNTIDLGGGTTKGCDCKAPDLGDYAKKEDVPTKVSQLENDSGFVKEVDYLYLPDIGITEPFSLDLNIENITKEQSDAIIKAGRFKFAPPLSTPFGLGKNPIFTLEWQETYATFGFYSGVPDLEARAIEIKQKTIIDNDLVIFNDAIICISTTGGDGTTKENAVIEKLKVTCLYSGLFRMNLENSEEKGAINWEVSGNTAIGRVSVLKAKINGLGTAAYKSVEEIVELVKQSINA